MFLLLKKSHYNNSKTVKRTNEMNYRHKKT